MKVISFFSEPSSSSSSHHWMITIREAVVSAAAAPSFICLSHHSGQSPKLKLPVSHYQVGDTICIVNSRRRRHSTGRGGTGSHEAIGYREINSVNTGTDLPVAFTCLLINGIMSPHLNSWKCIWWMLWAPLSCFSASLFVWSHFSCWGILDVLYINAGKFNLHFIWF